MFRSAVDARNHRRHETALARHPGEMTHSGPYPPNKARNGRAHNTSNSRATPYWPGPQQKTRTTEEAQGPHQCEMNHSGLCASAALIMVSSIFGLHSQHTRFCLGQRWHLKPSVPWPESTCVRGLARAKAAASLPEKGFLASQLEMLVAPIVHQRYACVKRGNLHDRNR
jgi:hypothetical protein